MKRVEGTMGVALIECVNPVKNKWRVRWDVQPAEGYNSVTYMEEEFSHKPASDEIKAIVMDWYNSQINTEIQSGFKYDGYVVWLSQENQFNYKASFDLAVQTNGATLPVTFKFGDNDYYKFESLQELSDFYTGAMKHVQSTLESGWKKKDAFDLNLYQLE